jgi:hypothetical protein
MNLLHVAPSAINFAEGWLSGGYGGLYRSGWNGARYHGYPMWQRPIKALLIAQDMRKRKLVKGFDLKSLDV